MTKNELLESIRKGRAELEGAIEGLSPEQLTAPGVQGEWSVKDVVGHIAMWESHLVTTLYTAGQGAAVKLPRAEEVDKINAQFFAEQRERPLERVMSDFRAVHQQLLKRLQALPEHDLDDPSRWKWLKGKPLASHVAGDTFEHYAEHLLALRAWRARLLAA